MHDTCYYIVMEMWKKICYPSQAVFTWYLNGICMCKGESQKPTHALPGRLTVRVTNFEAKKNAFSFMPDPIINRRAAEISQNQCIKSRKIR